MDFSNSSVLNSISYYEILHQLALYNNENMDSDLDEAIINEIKSVLPYEIDDDRCMCHKPLIHILKDLNIHIDITTENFYLLIRSINLTRLEEFDDYTIRGGHIGDYVIITNKPKFIIAFKEIYKNKYDSILSKIISAGRVKQTYLY